MPEIQDRINDLLYAVRHGHRSRLLQFARLHIAPLPLDERRIALSLECHGDMVVLPDFVWRHRVVRRGFARIFRTRAVLGEIRPTRPREHEVVRIIRAVIKNARPALHSVVPRPYLNSRGCRVEHVRSKINVPCAPVAVSVAHVNLAAVKRHVCAALRRVRAANRVSPVAVETPAVRQLRRAERQRR